MLLAFATLLLVFLFRVRAGHLPKLRRIAAFEQLHHFNSRAIESGRPLHLSLGTGSATDASTADSLAGLSVLEYLAKRASATGVQPIVSMSDPTVMLFAQNILRGAQRADPRQAADAGQHIRWVAPQPAAYAAGVMSMFSVDRVYANIMVGKFGDEYLLMGEAAAWQHIPQIGGTGNPNALPFIYTTAQETLLGEEIYAAGAYLQKQPAHIGSLLAQDTMRWLLFLLMLGGIIWATLKG